MVYEWIEGDLYDFLKIIDKFSNSTYKDLRESQEIKDFLVKYNFSKEELLPRINERFSTLKVRNAQKKYIGTEKKSKKNIFRYFIEEEGKAYLRDQNQIKKSDLQNKIFVNRV